MLKQLEASPRHSKWVEDANGTQEIKCFVVYPEVSTKAIATIAIHENKGFTDWVCSFAGQLAAASYVVVAPDLLSDFNATIPSADSLMKLSGKTYDYKLYPGAGHTYMRSGGDPAGSVENKEDRNLLWIGIKEVPGKV